MICPNVHNPLSRRRGGSSYRCLCTAALLMEFIMRGMYWVSTIIFYGFYLTVSLLSCAGDEFIMGFMFKCFSVVFFSVSCLKFQETGRKGVKCCLNDSCKIPDWTMRWEIFNLTTARVRRRGWDVVIRYIAFLEYGTTRTVLIPAIVEAVNPWMFMAFRC